jgi:hypothetical protein
LPGRTASTGLPVQDCQDRTSLKDCQNRTAGTRLSGQEGQNKLCYDAALILAFILALIRMAGVYIYGFQNLKKYNLKWPEVKIFLSYLDSSQIISELYLVNDFYQTNVFLGDCH